MTSSEKFCVKWNDFQENIASSFSGHREDLDFSDVTLVSEEDNRIEAHRVILSACSPFFSSVLKKTKHPHPMIYMRGLKSKDLSAIVDFIYHGEANISPEDLDGFLALAEELKLQGITGPNDNTGEKIWNSQTHKISKQSMEILEQDSSPDSNILDKYVLDKYIHEQIATTAKQFDYISATDKFEDNSIASVKSDKITAPVDPENKDLHAKIASFMENVNDGERNKWRCTVCGKTTSLKGDIKRHVEIHIEGISYPCNICETVSRS